MGAIVWDQVGERTYETGTKKGVLYPQAANGTYPNGVPWNGLTSVSESPEGGDANDIYVVTLGSKLSGCYHWSVAA